MSTSGNMPNWQRKESVTIVERAEDERDAEDETEAEMVFQKPEIEHISCLAAYRRASSAGEHSEDQFLTVPKSITASSSAETLTGNIFHSAPFKLQLSFVHLLLCILTSFWVPRAPKSWSKPVISAVKSLKKL